MADDYRYPEHAKLRACKREAQALGEFIETGGYVLCVHREAPDVPRWIDAETGEPSEMWRSDSVQNPDWFPSGLYAVQKSVSQIVAEFFGIDQAALDREKVDMLEEIRRLQETLPRGGR